MKKTLLLMTLVVLTALATNAATRTVWQGSKALNWGYDFTLSASDLGTLKAGDEFKVTYEVTTDDSNWPQYHILDAAKNDLSSNNVKNGTTENGTMLTQDMVTALSSGAIIWGGGVTITKVEIVEGDGGDYSHAVWIGECKIGNWDGYQQVAASAFAKAAVGQTLRLKFKNLGAGAYLSLRNAVDNWPDLSGTEGTYIAGSKQDFTITSAMLSELKANGMIISGVNFTATAVELWNADEIKTLKLQVPVSYNWVFEGTDVPTFYVGITNPYSTAVEARIVMEVATDKMAFVTSSSKTVSVQGNNAQRIEDMKVEGLEPGIYHATITVNNDLARGFYFAVRPTEIVSAPDKQSDFDSYWAAAKEQLAAVPINATLTEIPAKSSAKRKVYLVEMQSIADGLSGDPVTIRGYYAEPTDGKKHPVLIHYQGYDSEYRPGGDSATPWCINANWDTEEGANFAEFILSNRGQSVNNRPASGRDDGIQKDFTNTYGDWFAYEFGNKDKYYYRGAYMDCLRAIDFMASRETSDMQNLFAEGQSQGGAFTVAAAALSDYKFNAIAPAITFMGDFPDYFQIVSWPGYVAMNCQAEINKKGGAMTDADMYAFMSYYDTKNLATSITSPYITSIGLQDNVCPPHTNIAPYNNAQTAADDKDIIYNPELQHQTNSDWNETYMTFFKKYMKDTTGIKNVRGLKEDGRSDFFDLQGRRVVQPVNACHTSTFRLKNACHTLKKGLYIKNGHKYIVR